MEVNGTMATRSNTNEMLAMRKIDWNLLRSWLLVVDVIGCGWNPPADLNGMPAVCCVCPVAGEKFPSLTNPVCAVVPPWGVRLPGCGCCCWKLPCTWGNCWPWIGWPGLTGIPPARSCCACWLLNCCWCCCINLKPCVNCCRTFCCCGVRFWVCWRQCSICSCCWLR